MQKCGNSKAVKYLIQEKSHPHTFSLALTASLVVSVIPVACTDQRLPMFTIAEFIPDWPDPALENTSGILLGKQNLTYLSVTVVKIPI